MPSLEAPLWLLALPLPLLVWWLAPPYRTTVEALRAPFFADLVALTGQEPQEGAVVLRRRLSSHLMLVVTWLCCVLALANPIQAGAPQTVTRSARDTLLALDLSGSMRIRDFQSTQGEEPRIDGVKSVLRSFVAGRQGDRLGVLVFGAAPFVQVPFTADLELVQELIDSSSPGMAGDQTVLGDAIGLALRVFESSPTSSHVLLLLTDGNDTGSLVPPLQAAAIAAQRGVTIHVVGVGDPKAAGEKRLDERTLRGIAEATGGSYFFAGDEQALETIYADLDALAPVVFESDTWRPERTLFSVTLGLATVLLLVFVVSNLRRRP